MSIKTRSVRTYLNISGSGDNNFIIRSPETYFVINGTVGWSPHTEDISNNVSITGAITRVSPHNRSIENEISFEQELEYHGDIQQSIEDTLIIAGAITDPHIRNITQVLYVSGSLDYIHPIQYIDATGSLQLDGAVINDWDDARTNISIRGHVTGYII